METGRAVKLFRTGVGKLFLIAAGCGALVLVIFVLMPMLTPTPPQEPEQPSTPQDIVAEVMGGTVAETPDEQPGERLGEPLPTADGMAEEAEEQSVMEVPAPLLALPTADMLPVVFPREEPETAEDPAEVDEAEAAGDGLPPLLTPEEIEAALPEPAPPTDPTRAVDSPAAEEIPEGPAPEMVVQVAAAGDEAAQGRGDARPVQALVAMPLAPPAGAPPAAVREVQALLKELGYAPGPVDGAWGVRTEEAWHAFARDAERLARGMVLESAGERPILETPLDEGSSEEPDGLGVLAAAVLAAAALESRSPSEAASPSEAPSLEAVPGSVQAGNTPPGLPAHPVTLPGTLRGVMGYRMPLISRQEVPDQVVSGVLIPAHTTFVILKPGYWELTGLTPDDVELLQGAEARAEAEALAAKPEPEPQPVKRGWNPLRLFRKGKPAASTP